jgi:hypothetical protein
MLPKAMPLSKSNAPNPSPTKSESAKSCSIILLKDSVLKEFFFEDLPDGVFLPTRPLETTMRNQYHKSCKTPAGIARTVVRAGGLFGGSRLGRAFASGSDLVLSAVVNGVLQGFGLLLDRAEAVLDGIVGGAEVGGDVANVDLCGVVRYMSEMFRLVVETYSGSGSNDSSDKLLPDFDGVPGELAWSCHGWRCSCACGDLEVRV